MEQALVTAKQVLVVLNDIHPNISVCGLDEESAKIQKMKDYLTQLVGVLTPDHPRLEQVVESCRADALSSFEEVIGASPAPLSMATDEHLENMYLAAANWIERYRDYVSAREGYRMHIKATNGGDHAG